MKRWRRENRLNLQGFMLSISYLGPSYVALVPQVEEVEEGEQTKPPGFHVIYILSRTQLCSSGSPG